MGRSQRIILGALSAAQLMLIVDVVALNVALPSIRDSLDIPLGQLQLANVSYTLTFGSLLVVAGRVGDTYGRRRVFRIGLVVFTVASVLNALAPTGPAFFAGRALQGIGAALVSPTALAMLTATFGEGETRNRALGVWAAVGSGGAILGQVVGGVLTDAFGWRSIFLINVPIAAVAIGAVTRLVPETHGDRVRLDVRGATLLAAGVAVLTLALQRIAEHGIDPWMAAGTIAAASSFVVLWHIERRHPNPLVRVALLAIPGVRIGNGVLALLAGGTVAGLFFSTLYLQGSLGYSAFAVGIAFAPVTGIVLVLSPLAGRLVTRVGVRALLCTGTTLAAGGLLLLSRVSADGSYASDVLPGLVLIAIGNGLAFAPTMTAATSGISPEDQGLASGLIGTSQELGTAFGLALAAPIAAAAAGDGPGADAPIDGYRIGAIVAAALIGIAAAIAARTPRSLGIDQSTGSGEEGPGSSAAAEPDLLDETTSIPQAETTHG